MTSAKTKLAKTKPARALIFGVVLAAFGATGALAECQVADAKLNRRSAKARVPGR